MNFWRSFQQYHSTKYFWVKPYHWRKTFMTECIWRRIPKKPKETKNLRRSQKHQKLTVKEQGSSAGKSVRQTHFRNLVTENSFAVVRNFYVVRERHSLWWYVKQFALCVCVKINVHGTNIYSFCIHPTTQQLKCILWPEPFSIIYDR